MKQFSYLFLTAMALGGVFAFAIQSTALVMQAPKGVPPLLANTPAQRAGSFLPSGLSSERSAHPSLREALPEFGSSVTLLLSEPVLVLSGPGPDSTSLPRGTSVQLLASNGDYLVIRHGSDTITVPRSAVVDGVRGRY